MLACSLACGVCWLGSSAGCGSSASNSVASSNDPQQGVVYYIDDHLGSTTLVTDSQGNVLREESRYPYGLDRKVDNPGSVDADYVYTGKEYDEETGLVYFGGRYYAPEMGRWASPDNHFIENPRVNIEQMAPLNLYAFVRNNPVTYIDPDGRIENSAFEQNKRDYAEQYRMNIVGGPKSREEAVFQKIVGTGVIGIAAAPVIVPTIEAIAPYAASAELAAGRAAYTATRVLAEKASVEAGYAAGFGRSAVAAARTVADGMGESGFEASIRGIELVSKVVSAPAIINGIEASRDLTSGYYMPDAPKNSWEFAGAAVNTAKDLYDRGYFENSSSIEPACTLSGDDKLSE